jgi:hypothetical protein
MPGIDSRAVVRDLPRVKVALVVLVVLVNMGVVLWRRCCELAVERRKAPRFCVSLLTPEQREYAFRYWESLDRATFVPPWEWTSSEWRETVWPWK